MESRRSESAFPIMKPAERAWPFIAAGSQRPQITSRSVGAGCGSDGFGGDQEAVAAVFAQGEEA